MKARICGYVMCILGLWGFLSGDVDFQLPGVLLGIGGIIVIIEGTIEQIVKVLKDKKEE